jgi:hypothetical protein
MKLWHIAGAIILAIGVNVAAMFLYDKLTKNEK